MTMNRMNVPLTFRLLAAAALVLSLAACVTTQQAQVRHSHADKVHQNAPEWMKASWQRYLRNAQGRFAIFALDRNGHGAGWNYCVSACQRLFGSQSQAIKSAWAIEVIESCEAYARQNSPGTRPDCDIYAIKDEIVWEHPFPWSVAAASRQDTRAVEVSEPKRDGEQRTITLSWVGSTDVYRGSVTLQQRVGGGRMYGSLAGRDCEGQFQFTSGRRGEWEIDCDNGWLTVGGEFTATGDRGGGSRGTGVDSEGRMVEFVLDPSGGS